MTQWALAASSQKDAKAKVAGVTRARRAISKDSGDREAEEIGSMVGKQDSRRRDVGTVRITFRKASMTSRAKERRLKCWKCGKRGHVAKDCWSGKGGKGSKGGKDSRGRKDVRCGAGAFTEAENGEKPCGQEPEHEVGFFDGCAFGSDADWDPSHWLRITLDQLEQHKLVKF